MSTNQLSIDIIEYTPQENAFADRVILVTGAGDGIGRAAALAYARYGAELILLGRTARKLEAVYDEILAAGGRRPSIVHLDLAKAQGPQYDSLVAALEQGPGRLDGIVHNAAILERLTPIEHHDIGLWQRTLHVNLTVPFVLTRCLAPLLRASPDASVIFTSSSAGRRGKAFWGAYAASKFGIEGLMQVLADEWANQARLRANCINPGPTRTSMRQRVYPAEDRSQLRTPQKILGPYLFLMGPDSRGVNGLSVDCQPPPAG
jgi:NAD(P)-dependent dehydrogenase (short-subunit alcohol dehydrogenase family)